MPGPDLTDIAQIRAELHPFPPHGVAGETNPLAKKYGSSPIQIPSSKAFLQRLQFLQPLGMLFFQCSHQWFCRFLYIRRKSRQQFFHILFRERFKPVRSIRQSTDERISYDRTGIPVKYRYQAWQQVQVGTGHLLISYFQQLGFS